MFRGQPAPAPGRDSPLLSVLGLAAVFQGTVGREPAFAWRARPIWIPNALAAPHFSPIFPEKNHLDRRWSLRISPAPRASRRRLAFSDCKVCASETFSASPRLGARHGQDPPKNGPNQDRKVGNLKMYENVG